MITNIFGGNLMIQHGLYNVNLKESVAFFCSNNFTCTKCIYFFSTLSVMQHVSARGALIVIITCCDNNYKYLLMMTLCAVPKHVTETIKC
jgi:hypothetical protein